MIKFSEQDRFFISEELIGQADKLVEEKTFETRVDFLLYGAAYAISNNLLPATGFKRHPLGQILSSLPSDLKISFEMVISKYCEEKSIAIPSEPKELMNTVCCLGIEGARKLSDIWKTMSRSQKLNHILDVEKANVAEDS